MKILGVSAFYHDSAAVLLDGEHIIAAAQEEKFTRIKHDASFPINAIEYCLTEAECDLKDIENVVYFEKPFLKFERLLESYVSFAPRGFQSFKTALPSWVREKLLLRKVISQSMHHLCAAYDWKNKLKFSEHHLSHAASAFYPSPFEEAVILTLDGVGEWVTTSVAIGRGNKIDIIKEIHFPHSLGLLYSAFTYYTGFRVNSGEYKLMGLAPYGTPVYVDLIIKHLIDVKDDGSYRLNQQYFNYCTGLTMINRKFEQLFGQAVRQPEDPIEQFHMDIAASIQAVVEKIVLRLSKALALETGIRNLCLAGGVALNCVVNGKLKRASYFENIWVQPAAGDAGGALGAAQALAYLHYKTPRIPKVPDNMQGAYLGCSYSNQEIEQSLRELGAVYTQYSSGEMLQVTVQQLAQGKAVGWFQGRMEFGPRALGARSILGDPRNPEMQKTLNLKIKYRESFRPFAPSVLAEQAHNWFDLQGDSPYMLLVDQVKNEKHLDLSKNGKTLYGFEKLDEIRSKIPAVTHVDYSARIQTVHKSTNSLYHQLLKEFENLTGCPVLINTSFNVRGEPIVCTPEDAFRCFMGTELDILSIGDFVLFKRDQSEAFDEDHKNKFMED